MSRKKLCAVADDRSIAKIWSDVERRLEKKRPEFDRAERTWKKVQRDVNALLSLGFQRIEEHLMKAKRLPRGYSKGTHRLFFEDGAVFIERR